MYFHVYKVIKSQRPHKCSWCFGHIPKGASLFRGAGLSLESDFFSFKLHPECYFAMKNYNYSENECWLEGEQARGRIDSDKSMSPEFDENGKTIASFKLV